ncbi:MAG TPA: hypothetical protein VJ815_02870 [Acidimicrobiia bacterium]|nr:hypothetical protein [Acidimicrobiia bacterium]
MPSPHETCIPINEIEPCGIVVVVVDVEVVEVEVVDVEVVEVEVVVVGLVTAAEAGDICSDIMTGGTQTKPLTAAPRLKTSRRVNSLGPDEPSDSTIPRFSTDISALPWLRCRNLSPLRIVAIPGRP